VRRLQATALRATPAGSDSDMGGASETPNPTSVCSLTSLPLPLASTRYSPCRCTDGHPPRCRPPPGRAPAEPTPISVRLAARAAGTLSARAAGLFRAALLQCLTSPAAVSTGSIRSPLPNLGLPRCPRRQPLPVRARALSLLRAASFSCALQKTWGGGQRLASCWAQRRRARGGAAPPIGQEAKRSQGDSRLGSAGGGALGFSPRGCAFYTGR
jgi:hypothetical protein